MQLGVQCDIEFLDINTTVQELIRRWDSERELFFTTSHM